METLDRSSYLEEGVDDPKLFVLEFHLSTTCFRRSSDISYSAIQFQGKKMSEEKEASTMDVVSNIKTNLTCQVCANFYEDPRILPCLHTFCCQCIETLLRNRPIKDKLLKCPTCQLDTGLENRKAVRKLPANSLLVSLLDLLLIQEGEAVECDVCDNSEELSAHVRCRECSVYLCELHAEAHKKARDTKQHVLLSLGKLQ